MGHGFKPSVSIDYLWLHNRSSQTAPVFYHLSLLQSQNQWIITPINCSNCRHINIDISSINPSKLRIINQLSQFRIQTNTLSDRRSKYGQRPMDNHPFNYGQPLKYPAGLFVVLGKQHPSWGRIQMFFPVFLVILPHSLCPLVTNWLKKLMTFSVSNRILSSWRSKPENMRAIPAAFHRPLSHSWPGHRCFIILILLRDVVRLMTELPCC